MPPVEGYPFPSIPQATFTDKRKTGSENEERGENVMKKKSSSQGGVKKGMIIQGCYPTQRSRDKIKSKRDADFDLDHLSLPNC